MGDFTQQEEPQTERTLNKLSIKPTFDVGADRKPDFYPFNLLKDSSTFTYSNATIKGNTKTLDSLTSYQITDGAPHLIQKQDTIGGYTFGDDTDLETIFFMKDFKPYEVTQCFVQAAFATNITAYTDNGVTFDSIDFEVRKYLGTNLTKYDTILKSNTLTGFSQMTGADAASVFIFQAQFGGQSIETSDTIGLYFKCNNTKVITNTYQSMLLPLFSFTKTDYTKVFFESGLIGHALPSFDAAQQSLKHELPNYRIDTFGAPK